MIRRIGVVCQDANSFGFLEGIRRRLHCEAELIQPATGALGKSARMKRGQAKLAAADLRKKAVDLIVRFNDADDARWQDTRRHELEAFPPEVSSMLVVGVAVNNTEQWLALDLNYLGQALNLTNLNALPTIHLTGTIKTAIALARRSDEPVWEVTARLVADAPLEVFRAWLKKNDSLRTFYADCRQGALLKCCDVPNELEG